MYTFKTGTEYRKYAKTIMSVKVYAVWKHKRIKMVKKLIVRVKTGEGNE